MKNLILGLGLLSTILFACNSGTTETQENTLPAGAIKANGNYTIEPNSFVNWIGSKKAYAHNGKVAITSGQLVAADGTISSAKFDIDVNSITCEDIEDQENNSKLIGHLKSPDFFAADSFPTMTFEMTKCTIIENKQEGSEANYNIEGNLTIKGITNPIAFPATIKEINSKLMVAAGVSIDRTKWNIKFNSGSFFKDLIADKIINDEIKLSFSVYFNPVAAQ